MRLFIVLDYAPKLVASTRANVLDKRVDVFTGSFAPSELCFHACSRFDVSGLQRPVRELSAEESLEELENLSEDESPIVSFESRSCSLELELQGN